ncbi:unnamed protein product [Polarella glacialis]|uniref:Uncharacterized protein n=1 Tax=Polarella glacialis TaxID=89957 RepID=A0A813L728_POLGL|nr:unnamed protein product [Polarella glacialis]
MSGIPQHVSILQSDEESACLALSDEAADRAMCDFYESMASRARQQRRRRQRMCLGPLPAGSSKRNLSELYLDLGQRAELQASSRAYLRKHAARLGSACESSLRGLVALQHFFDLDLGDLSLPRELRRSDDEFVDETGPNQDVSLQMVMDATRALYVVEGATMDFASELSASGLDLEEVPHEVERLKADFADRLVQCVRSCLGSHAHSCPELLRAVTNAMSQSGLANMERACSDCPQVVVSGGEQRLVFDLRRADALGVATWALHLLVEKTDFESCLAVVDEEPWFC